MVIVVKCLECGREVEVRIDKIEDALKLTCSKCKERGNETN